ncbi:MAG: HAMP domain-containing histidine kinase [Micromonosporaceae bacterium]|nr:HAMP domain-containing histidine kinase [Micromonosporaceae bacterium]
MRPRRRPAPGEEQRLIDHTWRRMTVQTAAIFAAALLLLDLLAIVVVVQSGQVAAHRQVAQAIADRDALTSPPHGIWVYRRDASGQVVRSPGAPAAPPAPADQAAAAADGRARDRVVNRDGREYQVRTERQGHASTQAAVDITEQDRQRHDLYLGLGAAGIGGLCVAMLVGAEIARRSIRPLGLALSRQHRFIADASHELRTPLTQLHTRAQLVDRALRAGTQPHQLLADTEQLVRGTRQMAEILDDLLLAARLRNAPAEFGPVDLGELAAEAVRAEQPRAEERAIQLLLDADPAARYVVRGAATALGRVLTSLIDNALGHTPAGGHIAVRLRPSVPAAGSAGAMVSCTVADDGSGFDPADQQLIFQRFARGGNGASGEGRRYGLGLALVQETVEAHRGTLTAAGSPGKGATFTLHLPAWDGPDRPAGGPAVSP